MPTTAEELHHPDLAADKCRGAEASAPELMAEHGDACRRFAAVFTGNEAAAGLHPDAEDVEVIAGHGIRRRRAAHLIRLEVD
jgi:hypothetical protein